MEENSATSSPLVASDTLSAFQSLLMIVDASYLPADMQAGKNAAASSTAAYVDE
jgi:hypothetical protein